MVQAPRPEPRAPRRRRRRPVPRGPRATEPGAPQPPGSRARRRRAEEAREERSGRSRRGVGPRTQFMAGTGGRQASGPGAPGQRAPMERAAAGAAGPGGGSLGRLPAPQPPSTPRRCPAEQPLKPGSRGAPRAGAEGRPAGSGRAAPGARPRRGSARCVLRRPARRGPRAAPAVRRPPSRDRAAGAAQAAEPLRAPLAACPAGPLPGTQGLRPTSAPPPPRPPARSPPSGRRRCVLRGASQRAGSRGIAPGSAPRPPLGFLGLVVRAASRPAPPGPRGGGARPRRGAEDAGRSRILCSLPCWPLRYLSAPASPDREAGSHTRPPPAFLFVSKRLVPGGSASCQCLTTALGRLPPTRIF